MGFRNRLLVLSAVVFSGFASLCRAESGWTPGVYMAQAIDEMLVAARVIGDETTLGYDDNGVCLVGCHLHPGDVYELNRPFAEGVEVVLLAGGDTDARDIDLAILDKNGNVLAEDTTTDRMAALTFTAPGSGNYTVRLALYKANRDAFCTFAVMRRAGFDVPVINLATAREAFLRLCMGTAIQGAAIGKETAFLAKPNQGAVFASVLAGGESATIRNLDLGDAPSVILAAGDTQTNDIDLRLMDEPRTGEWIDKDPDATPIVVATPSVQRSYTIEAINADPSGRAAFVLFGVLQMQ